MEHCIEYLNLYDENGNLCEEKGIRGEKTDKYKGISSIFIENSKGEFLLQKTSASRNSIYATTGGHVQYGSNFYETIIREVKEELGLDISNEKIIEIETIARYPYLKKIYYLKTNK